jgi:hypothetical protein
MSSPTRSQILAPLAATAALFLAFACSSAAKNGGGTGGDEDTGGKGTSTGGKAGTGGKGSGGSATGGKGSGGDSGGGAGGDEGGAGGSAGGNTGGGGSAGGAGGMVMGPPLKGDGCAGGTCQNPTCKALGTAAPIGDFAEIGFEMQPMYIPKDTVIPTFDDAPDGPIDGMDPTQKADFITYGMGTWTKQIVDYLDSKSLHMDFFINTNNWCGDVLQDPTCVETVTKILKSQNPANHTVHHTHMGGNTSFDPMDISASSCSTTAGAMLSCDTEMKGVEMVIDQLSNGGRPHLTRFRAPYGEPFQVGGGAIQAIKTLTKKYAVHVGWSFDTQDSKCDSGVPPCITATQVADAVKGFIGNAPGQGQGWGVILMHGTYPWTYDAVKMLFDPQTGYLKTHGFKLATVEDAVCWKYGKHSWEIVNQLAPGSNRTAN